MICETMAGDNRFEIIAKAKHAILEGTNIETSEDEMKVLDNFLFRCWQMGWLDKYDEKVETEMSLPKWIPVSERLPENSGCVLISIAGDIEFGAYDRQNHDWAIWRDGYWDEGKRADAWMPLPEPYREDGDEE